MVFAVRCPNPHCRKYMLVEERDLNRVVPCLLCRTPIQVGNPQGAKPEGGSGTRLKPAPPHPRGS